MHTRPAEMELSGKLGNTYPAGVAITDEFISFSFEVVAIITRHINREMAIEHGEDALHGFSYTVYGRVLKAP